MRSTSATVAARGYLACSLNYGNTVLSPPSGWTALTGAVYGGASYIIVPTVSGALTPTWSGVDNYAFWASVGAAYKAAGGGGGQVPPIARGFFWT